MHFLNWFCSQPMQLPPLPFGTQQSQQLAL
jgi:hypothetical protein